MSRRPPRGAGAAALVAALALSFAPPARGEDPACPSGNLLEHAQLVRWLDTAHSTALLTDGSVVPQGAGWLSQAVVFQSSAGSLTYDLGADLPIRALYLQADADDRFALLTSKDGKTWQGYAILEVPGGSGMRARFTRLEASRGASCASGSPAAPDPTPPRSCKSSARLPPTRPRSYACWRAIRSRIPASPR